MGLKSGPSLVKLLIEEDGEFKYEANSAGEAPLYIAAEKGCHAVVSEILKPFRAPAFGGPGGTALHAAVISNNQGGTNTLLDSKKDLVKEPDMYGWTPLHYAARSGHVQRAKQLLQLDKYIAYVIADKDDKMTTLHVAATHGHVVVMEELIAKDTISTDVIKSEGTS